MRSVQISVHTGSRLVTLQRLGRGLLIAAVVSLFATASAELCQNELGAAVSLQDPPAEVATALARAAVEAIEPALPSLRPASNRWDDPNAEWLDLHGYLPSGWNEQAPPSSELWAELLGNLQRPYRVVPAQLSGNTDPQTLLSETQVALQRMSSAVRPLALVATRPGHLTEIASVSVIWNWSPWPRLLIFRPSEIASGAADEIAELLVQVGTCAWQPRAYFQTDLNVATGFYLGNAQTQLRLLATDIGPSWEFVAKEQERTVFTFEGDLLQGASVAAVDFEGPGPSTWQVMKFLTTAQTNVGAFDLPFYLALP